MVRVCHIFIVLWMQTLEEYFIALYTKPSVCPEIERQ